MHVIWNAHTVFSLCGAVLVNIQVGFLFPRSMSVILPLIKYHMSCFFIQFLCDWSAIETHLQSNQIQTAVLNVLKYININIFILDDMQNVTINYCLQFINFEKNYAFVKYRHGVNRSFFPKHQQPDRINRYWVCSEVFHTLSLTDMSMREIQPAWRTHLTGNPHNTIHIIIHHYPTLTNKNNNCPIYIGEKPQHEKDFFVSSLKNKMVSKWFEARSKMMSTPFYSKFKKQYWFWRRFIFLM